MQKVQFWISLIAVVAFLLSGISVALAENPSKININTASADELVQLKGIGPKKAEAIIEFRENNGPFELPEDFMKVPGIGPKTFETNKDRISVK